MVEVVEASWQVQTTVDLNFKLMHQTLIANETMIGKTDGRLIPAA